MTTFQIVIGVIFGALSLLDAWKYRWEARKIREVGTSAGHSRKFINAALASDTAKLAYGLAIMDWFVIFSGVVAMICMTEMWVAVWQYYPYHKKKFRHHRPDPWTFLIKSITHPDKPL